MYTKKLTLFAAPQIAALLAASSLALCATAAEFDWKDCRAETEKFCKQVKGDEAIYECLQQHDEKLSKTCDATHSKYEVMTKKKKS